MIAGGATRGTPESGGGESTDRAELGELIGAGFSVEEAHAMVAARQRARRLSERLESLVRQMLADAEDPASPREPPRES